MRFAIVRRFALSLPGVVEQPHFQYSSFRIRGKIFVTVPPDEEHIHVFVGEQKRDVTLALHPEFAQKLMWGAKAIGLRIELVGADPIVVKSLIKDAWEGKSAKGRRSRAKTPG